MSAIATPERRLDKHGWDRQTRDTLCGAKWGLQSFRATVSRAGMVQMDDASRRALAAVVSVFLVPFGFIAIFNVWSAIDNLLGAREVSRFIREHRTLVAERLLDPRVHSFSLGHAPRDSATLLIQFDVDDKAAYLMLEADLDDHWRLRSPAVWNIRVRSREDLGNNFGFAAQGMAEIGVFIWRVLMTLLASITLAGTYLFASLRRLRGHH